MSQLQEEAKKLLPLIQAAAEGKQIQIRADHPNATGDDKLRGRHWDIEQWQYRIKPEPRYRPYTREEFIEKCLGKPMVTDLGEAIVPIRLRCGPKGDFVFDLGPNSAAWNLADSVKFKRLDGKPCGELIEGDTE